MRLCISRQVDIYPILHWSVLQKLLSQQLFNNNNNSCYFSVLEFGKSFLEGLSVFNKLYKRYKKSRGPRMVKVESEPDQDPAINDAIDDFFNSHPEELLEDGSRPRVLLLAPKEDDSGSFRQFLWKTILTVAIFAIATVLTQSVYDKVGMFTSQRITND